MTNRDPDDETLMAYADGMLEAEEAKRIGALVRARPELARKVEMFRETSVLLRAAVAPLDAETVPAMLLAKINERIAEREQAESRSPENVLAFKSRSAGPAAIRQPIWRMAAAASIAAIAGGLVGYQIARDNAAPAQLAVGTSPSTAIVSALDRSRSGEELAIGADRLKMVSTFRLDDKTLCREFEYDSKADGAVVSIACRRDGTWSTRFAVHSQPAENGYAPASSFEAVEAYLSAVGAGAVLSADEEMSALQGN